MSGKAGMRWRTKKERESKPSCLYCGQEFIRLRTQSSKTFCSCRCANQHRGLARRPSYKCLQCGRDYYRHKHPGDVLRFCSRECSFAYKARKRKSLPIVPCRECGKEFASIHQAQYCSDECRRIKRNKHSNGYDAAKRHYHCKECGVSFAPEYGDKSRIFCSEVCRKRYGNRIGKAVRRARTRGLESESVDPFRVFQRHGWRCYLCGCETPRSLRGTLDARAPELDHITPLAKAGSHTYANTACACRECNQTKHDKPIGQLRLLG